MKQIDMHNVCMWLCVRVRARQDFPSLIMTRLNNI